MNSATFFNCAVLSSHTLILTLPLKLKLTLIQTLTHLDPYKTWFNAINRIIIVLLNINFLFFFLLLHLFSQQ